MPDLAELIRDELHAQAATVATPAELDDRTHARIDGRVRRRRALAGGGLAVVVLAIVATAAVAVPGGRPSVVAGPTQAQDALFVVPGWLPDGFALTSADGLPEDLPPPRSVTEDGSEVYVRFDPAREFAEAKLLLEWGLDPESGAEGIPTEVAGVTGYVVGDAVVWEQDGRLLRLSGELYTDAGTQPAPVPTLVDAAVVEVGAAGHPVIATPPQGFEGTGAVPDGPSRGVGVRWATYGGPGGGKVTVEVADATEVPPLSLVDGSLTRRITVRGHEGALLYGAPPATPGPTTNGNLIWEEHPGTQVRVTTEGVAEADLLRVATELRTVDEATWRSDILGDGTTASSPTTTAPAHGTSSTTTSTTGPTTATTPKSPPAGAEPGGPGWPDGPEVQLVPLTGTYSGTEHYSLGSAECPDMDHVYDATLTDDAGDDWAFHEDYCGRIDGENMWSGEGTFTLTGPDGDALAGTFTSRAPADGDGEPYTLTVTAGTGRYEGATGECTADNTVERVTLGTQRQSGELTCAIGVPGAPAD